MVKYTRVKAQVDNKLVLYGWINMGTKSSEANEALQQLYSTVENLDIVLDVEYIPSAENPADAPSRRMSASDAKLLPCFWERVENEFGPHTVDLMALDSNAQSGRNGVSLKHYTLWKTPDSAGVDVFTQTISGENNYVFPPFSMIGPVLKFLQEERALATVIIPLTSPLMYWWPIVERRSHKIVRLAQAGEKVWEIPTKAGHWVSVPSLLYDIFAY